MKLISLQFYLTLFEVTESVTFASEMHIKNAPSLGRFRAQCFIDLYRILLCIEYGLDTQIEYYYLQKSYK